MASHSKGLFVDRQELQSTLTGFVTALVYPNGEEADSVTARLGTYNDQEMLVTTHYLEVDTVACRPGAPSFT